MPFSDVYLMYIVMLQVLEAGYNRNPYHNATHAADVTQNVGVMLAADDLPSRLSKLEVLAMLLAAAVHDVHHPGQHGLKMYVQQSRGAAHDGQT
jgi:3'5'-cyclic nucleotide phosphodiesterase